MTANDKFNLQPGSAAQWYDLGCSLRQKALFGDAVNAFLKAASEARKCLNGMKLSSSEAEMLVSIEAKSLASIDLIKEINGFVNVDLLNP